jgi:uncharacterized membrane protein
MNTVKTTIIGGVVFLVPVIVLVVILGKALSLMRLVAAPLSQWIPVDSVAGIATANIVALVAVVLACFLAGLIARSNAAARAVRKLEAQYLSAIPGYAFIKSFTTSLGDDDDAETLRPVLVRFDDHQQVAFEVERIQNEQVVVYLPGAPDPWSGSVLVVEEDRVQRIEASMGKVVRNLRTLGRDSGRLLDR